MLKGGEVRGRIGLGSGLCFPAWFNIQLQYALVSIRISINSGVVQYALVSEISSRTLNFRSFAEMKKFRVELCNDSFWSFI